MKERRTSTCKANEHPEFILFADDAIVDDWIDWLVEYLQEAVNAGEEFKAAEVFRIGWILNKIEAEGKALTLLEPDFESLPIVWKKSVSRTVSDLFIQQYVAESVDVVQDLDFPTFTDTAIKCDRFANGAFWMERTPPSEKNPEDSGWFLGCIDDDHDHSVVESLSLISLYEATLINRFIVPFLPLPVGTYVFESGIGDAFDIGRDREPLPILADSYLGQMLLARQKA